MILLDVNILLYAYSQRAPEHERAKDWLGNLFDGREWIGLPWVTIWAFVRVGTNPRIQENPIPVEKAFRAINRWLSHSRLSVVEPGARHAEILERLVSECQSTGPRVTDAVLAALAIEQGATLASTDHDFGRFPDLHWINPLTEGPGIEGS